MSNMHEVIDMSPTHVSTELHHVHGCCEIRLEGHLDEQWADWFEGLTFTHESYGTTTLDGPLCDQAALHGVFNRLRDLGVLLISVHYVSPHRKKA